MTNAMNQDDLAAWPEGMRGTRDWKPLPVGQDWTRIPLGKRGTVTFRPAGAVWVSAMPGEEPPSSGPSGGMSLLYPSAHGEINTPPKVLTVGGQSVWAWAAQSEGTVLWIPCDALHKVAPE